MCKTPISPLTDGMIHEHWHIQMDEMQQSRQILDEIRQAFDEVKTQTQKVCADQRETSLLHGLAANYEGYKNFNPERVESTCEWFFTDERFHEWRDTSMSRLLWVTANPGCGKSALSRALINEGQLSTQVSTSTICHFFFKDGNEGQMRSPDALSAMLHQLFARDLTGGLIQHALPSHKNFGSGLAQNFSELWNATATLEAEFLFIPYAARHWALHFMSQEAPCALQAKDAARRLCDMSHEHTNRWTRAVRLEIDNPLTDLSLASRLGLKPIVELILSEGVAEAKHYNTALQTASRCGQVGVIDLLPIYPAMCGFYSVHL